MKLSAGRIEAFLRQPEKSIPTVLLYGPDQGLVAERAKRLLEIVIVDPSDPFLLTELDGETLRQHPGRLVEEAQALSLMGGRLAVRIREAAEAATKALGQLLELEVQEAFVVIEAGELGPSAPLRKAVERARNAVAIPCYREEGRGLAGSIHALLKEYGLSLDRDALAYLNEHLGVDHGVTRREIEKLAAFAGDQKSLGVEEVAAVIGDASALSLDDLIFAVLDRNPKEASRTLERIFAEGVHPIVVIRPLARFLMRLYRLASAVEQGTPSHLAVDQARPPIHFRRKDETKRALENWSRLEIAHALDRLGVAELLVKRTRAPAQLCCRQIIPDLALPSPPR